MAFLSQDCLKKWTSPLHAIILNAILVQCQVGHRTQDSLPLCEWGLEGGFEVVVVLALIRPGEKELAESAADFHSKGAADIFFLLKQFPVTWSEQVGSFV